MLFRRRIRGGVYRRVRKHGLGKGRINAVQYFPDGNKIAVATAIGTWIYDGPDG